MFKRWWGPSGSKLLLHYTILGGAHVGFPKIGRVRTRAVAAPMVRSKSCLVVRLSLFVRDALVQSEVVH